MASREICACVNAGKADKNGVEAIRAMPKAKPEPKIKTESKWGPLGSPKDFIIEADPPTSPVNLADGDGEDENYWGDVQPQDYEIPQWPDDDTNGTPIVDDDGTQTTDSAEIFVREGARAILLKNYTWAESTKTFVDIPQSFQDAEPMSKKARKELLKGIPENFTRVFPCKGPRALTDEDRARVRWWNELWFLETGAPRLHGHLVDELRALAFLAQECSDAPERIGLELPDLRTLLQKIITLHVDTMRLVANMQTKRAILATSRGSASALTPDPERLIISDKRREMEVKRAESKLAADIIARPLLKTYRGGNRKPPPFGGLGSTRRHRQPQSTPFAFARGTPRGGATRIFAKRGRGRGRAFNQGGTGRGQPSQF